MSNSHMTELRCLFLQNNNIEVIDGLATFEHLTNLNLCSNYISKLDNLKDLPNLHTLLLSRNKLATADDIEELSECKELGVLDLSYNSLNEPEVINVLERMPSLKVLTFMGNPIVRKTKEYRRMMILRLMKACRPWRGPETLGWTPIAASWVFSAASAGAVSSEPPPQPVTTTRWRCRGGQR